MCSRSTASGERRSGSSAPRLHHAPIGGSRKAEVSSQAINSRTVDDSPRGGCGARLHVRQPSDCWAVREVEPGIPEKGQDLRPKRPKEPSEKPCRVGEVY